jgi:hypothetical protein
MRTSRRTGHAHCARPRHKLLPHLLLSTLLLLPDLLLKLVLLQRVQLRRSEATDSPKYACQALLLSWLQSSRRRPRPGLHWELSTCRSSRQLLLLLVGWPVCCPEGASLLRGTHSRDGDEHGP